ncbi:MAG: hypothetical protein Q4Q14_00855 [Methanobrevibacter sp.]|nr:hypothetical protein [Methanobrevibacter sp.]
MYKISIIVQIFNVEKYFKQCFDISRKFIFDILESDSMVFDLLEKYAIDNLPRKLYFTKNHFNFFIVKLNKSKFGEDELSELFSSEHFLKHKNQKYKELNNFSNQLVGNHKSIEGKTLQLICKQTKNDIMNSDAFTPEITYKYREKSRAKNNSIDFIEKRLNSFIKKNAKLYNTIEDSKK